VDGANDTDGDSEPEFSGIGNISGSKLTSAATKNKAKASLAIATTEEDAPTLLNPDLPSLQAVIDQADVVLHVLDARDPLPYWSSSVEESTSKAGKKTALVLGKIGGLQTSPACFSM
jgi:nuclear GTP-binding protein